MFLIGNEHSFWVTCLLGSYYEGAVGVGFKRTMPSVSFPTSPWDFGNLGTEKKKKKILPCKCKTWIISVSSTASDGCPGVLALKSDQLLPISAWQVILLKGKIAERSFSSCKRCIIFGQKWLSNKSNGHQRVTNSPQQFKTAAWRRSITIN